MYTPSLGAVQSVYALPWGSTECICPPLGQYRVCICLPLGQYRVCICPPLGQYRVCICPPLGQYRVCLGQYRMCICPPLGQYRVCICPPLGQYRVYMPSLRAVQSVLRAVQCVYVPEVSDCFMERTAAYKVQKHRTMQ